jgi:ParB family transcriptional regulator, chromosome partitioning protein
MKSKGLGRGLDALLAANVEEAPTDSGRTLPMDSLVPGKYQPRTRMDQESLKALAQSIKTQGVIQPILVRAVNGGKFEIIAGERRWRAARIAELREVPVLVREVADEAALAMALIENIQREDLNPLEEAAGIARLVNDFHMTHQSAADAVGRSRSAVSNLLRLQQLPQPVQDMVHGGQLEMGHARALLSLGGNQLLEAARRIAERGLSVRETERLVAALLKPPAAKKHRSNRDVQRLQEELSESLGTKVEIKAGSKGSGKLVINYSSLDHLDDLLRKLKR